MGLGRLNDSEYLKAMQNINKAILNPIFLLTFVGPLISLFLVIILQINQPNSEKLIYLILAFVFYLVHFIITGARNVPLNKRLEKLDLNNLSNEKYAEARLWYEIPWNRWHTIRTIASIISVVFIFVILIPF